MYLSLPLSSPSSSSSSSASSRASSRAYSRARSVGSEKTITLEQALYNFTAEEELGEDNEWFCPKCKEQKQAYKKLDIWRLPEVLILHLKRFNQGKYRRSKLECAVEFPMTGLDMTSYVVETSPHRQDNNIYGAWQFFPIILLVGTYYGTLGTILLPLHELFFFFSFSKKICLLSPVIRVVWVVDTTLHQCSTCLLGSGWIVMMHVSPVLVHYLDQRFKRVHTF